MASRAPSSRARSTRFAAESDAPAYLPLWQSGELARRAGIALGRLRKCTLCPRHCAAAPPPGFSLVQVTAITDFSRLRRTTYAVPG